MTIQRLAAIDAELDDLATRIEQLRRRRDVLVTERRGIMARQFAAYHQSRIAVNKKAKSR